jgi:tagatose 6-phosphate kinase
MHRGDSLDQALKLATAAGAANALMPEAGNVRMEDVSRLLEQVFIETII